MIGMAAEEGDCWSGWMGAAGLPERVVVVVDTGSSRAAPAECSSSSSSLASRPLVTPCSSSSSSETPPPPPALSSNSDPPTAPREPTSGPYSASSSSSSSFPRAEKWMVMVSRERERCTWSLGPGVWRGVDAWACGPPPLELLELLPRLAITTQHRPQRLKKEGGEKRGSRGRG